MSTGHALYDAKPDGSPIRFEDARRLYRAIERAYGKHADVVILIPRNEREWRKAATTSHRFHEGEAVNVTLSTTGLNAPTFTSKNQTSITLLVDLSKVHELRSDEDKPFAILGNHLHALSCTGPHAWGNGACSPIPVYEKLRVVA